MRAIFNITGFGPFGGVEVNPSSALVRGIEQYCEKRGLPSDCSLGICHVLETSGIDSLATLHQLKQHHHSINDTTTTTATVTMTKVEEKHDANETVTETINQTSSTSTSTSKDFITVWLHFGVHGGATAFHLESTAYNVADFRIPDNRGWTPSNEPIIGSAPSQLTTALPIPELVSELAAKEWKVQESTDPGRFVCNWIYFNSLYHCQHGGQCTATSISPCDGDYSLFVHVPPSDVYNEASQLAFAHDLIACITQQLQAKTKHESQS